MKLCYYGCGKEAIHQLKNGNGCCSKSINSCPIIRRKFSESHKGKKRESPTEEHRKKLSESNMGKKRGPRKEEIKRKISKSMMGKNKRPKTKEHKENLSISHKGNEKSSNALKKARKQIKNPSDSELKLRKIVKELYPTSKDTYSILNYDVDISLEEYKIAIEYDGWYHFDTEEHIEYHKKREKEIRQEGWKFLRYSIYDKFPTKEQLKEDIKRLIE